MGMYDMINGEQVKCFGIPVFYGIENGVEQMGGYLRHYRNGRKVPYKTFFYNYSPNFSILDAHPCEEEDIAFLHVIRDGKVLKTVKFNEITEEDFCDRIIGYYGQELSVRCKEDILDMKDLEKIFFKEYNSIVEESDGILFKEMRKKLDEMRNIKDKKSLEFKNLEKEYSELTKKYEELKEAQEPLIKALIKRTREKYNKEISEMQIRCEKLGEYLAAEEFYTKNNNLKPEEIDFIRTYILKEIEDRDLVNAYCDFQEISMKKFNTIVNKVKRNKV